MVIIDSECGILSDGDDEKLGYYYCVDLLLVYLFSSKKFGLGSLLALRLLLIHAWFACFVNSIRLSMFLLLSVCLQKNLL